MIRGVRKDIGTSRDGLRRTGIGMAPVRWIPGPLAREVFVRGRRAAFLVVAPFGDRTEGRCHRAGRIDMEAARSKDPPRVNVLCERAPRAPDPDRSPLAPSRAGCLTSHPRWTGASAPERRKPPPIDSGLAGTNHGQADDSTVGNRNGRRHGFEARRDRSVRDGRCRRFLLPILSPTARSQGVRRRVPSGSHCRPPPPY